MIKKMTIILKIKKMMMQEIMRTVVRMQVILSLV